MKENNEEVKKDSFIRIQSSIILEYLLVPAIIAVTLTSLNEYVFPSLWDEELSPNVWVEFMLCFIVCVVIIILSNAILRAIRRK